MDKTKAWQRLESGKAYNQQLDPPYYDMVDTNWEMFKGNQYVNSNTSNNLPKPVFNIIKRVITFFTAMLTSSPVKVTYSTIVEETGIGEADLAILNAEFENFAERVKLQSKVRDSYKDGAITGDFAWHVYFDTTKKPYNGVYGDAEGEICMEIVDGANVYFGNANNINVEEQPYILITGRDPIKDLQKEYEQHNKDEEEIKSDDDTEYQAGLDSRIEIEDSDGSGKATYVIMYEKKTINDVEIVVVTKSVGDVDIYSEVETDLTRYPVVFDNYERQKNTYHGLALCTTIIPNQIFINRMFAMAMKNLMDTAFPKAVFNKNKLSGWSNQVGVAIPADMLPNESISNVAAYLDPGTMSPQIIQMLNLAWEYTKEVLGASDAMFGDVNPEQASGAAISVTAKQSAIPFTGPRDNMYDALENLASVFIDMVSAYYEMRPVVVDVEDGGKQVVQYDFSIFKGAYMDTQIDVGATTPYDEMSEQLTMERFLQDGHIAFKDLLESYPDIFPGADKVLKDIKEKETMEDQMIISQLDPMQQEQFAMMSEEEQQSMIQQYKMASQQQQSVV